MDPIKKMKLKKKDGGSTSTLKSASVTKYTASYPRTPEFSSKPL